MTRTSSQLEPAGPSFQPVMESNGPHSWPTPSTSRGTPNPSSEKPEAMNTGMLRRSFASESEGTSVGSSEKDGMPPTDSPEPDTGESGPAHKGPAEGGTSERSGTVADLKYNKMLSYRRETALRRG